MRASLRLALLILGPIFAVACSTDEPAGSGDDDVGSTSGEASSGQSDASTSRPSSSGGGTSSGGSGSSTSGSGGASSGGSSSSGGPVDPIHEDGIKNSDETDVDCGGAEAPPCEPTQSCLEGRDCTSLLCADAECTTPNDADGVKNGDETGTDCGGPTSVKTCPPSQGCADPTDCTEGVCNANLCSEPSNADGVKNGTETGVDCGGPAANPRCAPGKACVAPADCAEGVCTDQSCANPTDSDGVQNQGEKGIDCGGPNTAKRCAAGAACGEDADCTSDACTYDGKCATYRSCKKHMGGDTCGAGETYEAGRAHESCCETAVVASAGNVKLDKYNITAGRMRAFVEATNGEIKQWVQAGANKPAWWKNDWDNYLPTGLKTPVKAVDGENRNLGVYGQLGPNFVYDQAGDAGCWSGASAGQVGAPTYWIPTNERQALNPNDQGSLYSQDLLDQKALNCVNVLMVAAFCAWDGGRLPTIGELDAAWNGAATRTYPWGNSPAPAGYVSGYPNATPPNVNPPEGDVLRANFRKNYPQTGAGWNAQGNLQGNDLAFYIAPPGRFPTGAGPYGHMDLAGAVFNVTSTFTGSATDSLGMISRWSRSGSWETAHGIPYPTHASPVLRKYWAQGGRCVKN